MNMLQTLFAFCALGIVVVTIHYVILLSKLLSLLKEAHESAFERLGRPSLITNNSLQHTGKLLRFLFTREYISLQDPNVARLAGILRVEFVILVFLMIVSFVLVSVRWSTFEN